MFRVERGYDVGSCEKLTDSKKRSWSPTQTCRTIQEKCSTTPQAHFSNEKKIYPPQQASPFSQKLSSSSSLHSKLLTAFEERHRLKKISPSDSVKRSFPVKSCSLTSVPGAFDLENKEQSVVHGGIDSHLDYFSRLVQRSGNPPSNVNDQADDIDDDLQAFTENVEKFSLVNHRTSEERKHVKKLKRHQLLVSRYREKQKKKMATSTALFFKINEKQGVGPELLRNMLEKNGWLEYNDKALSGSAVALVPTPRGATPATVGNWHLWWRTNRSCVENRALLHNQKLNMCPASTNITRKDNLVRAYQRMRQTHGVHVYDFIPVSFLLPNEYSKFTAYHGNVTRKACTPSRDSGCSSCGNLSPASLSSSSSLGHNDDVSPSTGPEFSNLHCDSTDDEQNRHIWIVKPTDLSCGRGIFIIEEPSELRYHHSAYILQRYIHNPLLIGGYKFDLRFYVCVLNYKKIAIHVFEEALVRFSTAKYDLDNLSNNFSHLTNTSINKNSPHYWDKKSGVGIGCKWAFSDLRHHLFNKNIDDSILCTRVLQIIMMTVLMIHKPQSIRNARNYFDLYGFDILIDSDLKPWLMEVNICPALRSETEVDNAVKEPMIESLLNLLSDECFHSTPDEKSSKIRKQKSETAPPRSYSTSRCNSGGSDGLSTKDVSQRPGSPVGIEKERPVLPGESFDDQMRGRRPSTSLGCTNSSSSRQADREQHSRNQEQTRKIDNRLQLRGIMKPDFTKVFPFNQSTENAASQKEMDVKLMVNEITKLITTATDMNGREFQMLSRERPDIWTKF